MYDVAISAKSIVIIIRAIAFIMKIDKLKCGHPRIKQTIK